MKVDFYRHALDERDFVAAMETLRSIFLSSGPRVREVEEKFSRYRGRGETIAVNSCTAALHLGLLALGIGPGDEVIVPAMTFLATMTPVIHAGARPVFVDVLPENGLIDPAAVEKAITPRTKAILPVHLYGVMADMRALRAVADRYGLAIVEDAAHCVEGTRDGVRPGELADAVCYSFYATKNLTCGEGGAVATDDARLAEKMRLLRQHGMSKTAAERYTGTYMHWDMVELGWKYNLSDILAALLVNQIDRLASLHKIRQQVAGRYDAALAGVDGVTVPRIIGESAHHLYTVWVAADRRDGVLAGLQEAGIGVAVNYRAVHTLSWFAAQYGFQEKDFPHALAIGRQTISLPLYTGLTAEEQDYVVECLRKLVR